MTIGENIMTFQLSESAQRIVDQICEETVYDPATVFAMALTLLWAGYDASKRGAEMVIREADGSEQILIGFHEPETT